MEATLSSRGREKKAPPRRPLRIGVRAGDKRPSGPGAIDLLEEAVHLLRQSPAGILAKYYLGSLPFVLGLLYFWADMSRSAWAHTHHAAAALGMGCLFVWMKLWQAFFVQSLTCRLAGQSLPRLSWGRFWRLTASQSLVQSSALFFLPLSLLPALPLPWLYAYYQSFLILADGNSDGLKTISRRSWHQAKLWPQTNHVLLTLLFLFGLFVFLNIGLTIILAPHLLRILFGIETIFSMSREMILNTTFLLSTAALTYLALDPLIKTVYVLRCFYGGALRTGLDIKVQLAEVQGLDLKKTVLTAALILFVSAGAASAGAEDSAGRPAPSEVGPVRSSSPPAPAAVTAPELTAAIDEVLSRREFAWRSPRQAPVKDDEKGLLSHFFDWLSEKIKSWADAVNRWLEKLADWWENLWPDRDKDRFKPGPRETIWTDWLFYLLLGLVAVMLSFLAVAGYRQIKLRRVLQAAALPETAVPAPDMADETVSADQLPEDGWLTLARELTLQGRLLLAMRALYLATLAHLSGLGLVRLAKYKSNRDYQRELEHRAGLDPVLNRAFSENVGLFDQAWYGRYQVTDNDLTFFDQNRQRVFHLAGRQFEGPARPEDS